MGRAARQVGLGSRLGLAAIVVSALGLASCADVDNALFPPGDEAGAPAHQAASTDNTSSTNTPSTGNAASNETSQPAPEASNEAPAAAPPPEPAPQEEAQNEAPPESSQQTNEESNDEESGSDETWLDRLFGSEEPEQRPAPRRREQSAENPSEAPQESAPEAPTYAPTYTATGGGVVISPLEPEIRPINIAGGRDTGTSVNKTVQSLRSQAADLQQKMLSNASRTASVRNVLFREASTYESATSGIITRLQLGTTRANPELVSQWNTAQASLDRLSTNINSMASLGNAVGSDYSNARRIADQIRATYDVPGAVDEDHRQLGVLEDEESVLLATTDRIFRTVSAEVRRQASFISTERVNLANLQSSIKNGDPYVGSTGRGPSFGAIPSSQYSVASESGKPFVVIRFDRPDVDFQQILLAALNEALKTRPNASFKVVGIAPPARSARALAAAQSAARKHAQDVLQAMTGMGVPAGRLQVAALTDPTASSSEVRIFIL